MEDILDTGSNQSNSNGILPNATAVLVLGIISIIGCLFYGIPGLICGIIALALHTKDKKMFESNPVLYGDSFKNSRAGFVCAIIGVSLSSLFLITMIFAVASIINSPF